MLTGAGGCGVWPGAGVVRAAGRGRARGKNRSRVRPMIDRGEYRYHSTSTRASNKPSRSLKLYNHGEGLSVLNVKAVVAAFNQEKALVGDFSAIIQLQTM